MYKCKSRQRWGLLGRVLVQTFTSCFVFLLVYYLRNHLRFFFNRSDLEVFITFFNFNGNFNEKMAKIHFLAQKHLHSYRINRIIAEELI